MPAKPVQQEPVDPYVHQEAQQEPVEQPAGISLSAEMTVDSPQLEVIATPVESPDVVPAENLSDAQVETYQQAKVALGEDNKPVEGTDQEAEAMTRTPEVSSATLTPDTYAVVDKPLYGSRTRQAAAMHTYAVSVKDAYSPDHPAYINADARTQYFVTAPSQGQAIAQIRAIFPQYNEFEAKML